MTVKRHSVHFDVTAENATDRAFRAVEQNLNGINKAAAAVGKVLQGAFVATLAISAGKAFATAAMEAEQASIRLDAVLKATGNAAGLTKRELDEMADAMAESTQFDDESLRNASAQMLKFGNIAGETFRQGMKLSADLAAFMGTDLTTAVQSVGKALSSPKEGTGALERQIGKFNPAAKQMIEGLEQTGQSAKAQAAVLDLLRGKIGGTAEALNTGLTKASSDAKKQWDEMLESIGKTAPFQEVAKSGLNFVEQSFRDIKNIVENGDWVEKTLAVMAFAGGWRGMKLTPQAPDALNTVSGKIGGVKPVEPGIRTVLTKEERADFERQAAAREKAKKRRADRIKEQNEGAFALATFEAQVQEEANAATDKYYKERGEKRTRDLEEQAKASQMLSEILSAPYVEAAQLTTEAADSMVYSWDAAGNRIVLTREKFDQIADDAKKLDNIGHELGLTFTSAFEDAILEGKKLSDVLVGLSKDVGRFILRESITRPLGTAITDSIKGNNLFSGIGDFFKGLFGGGKAEGGPVMAGESYIVGERGPELFVPGGAGSIVPNDALGAGRGKGGPVFNIDMRGASVEAVARLERLVARMNGSIESMALGVMRGARVRGMA